MRFVIANQKGGVGKTTTAVNLAAALARLGQRTLLVDLDPQGNATMGSGIDKRELKHSVYEALIGMARVAEIARPAGSGGYSVLPANRELAGAELELVDLPERETRLLRVLQAVDEQYDYVLIDCPPSLSLLTLNGFCAAQGVIIPMQCEYYALEGLSDLVNTIRKVHANFNPELQITGLLRVMFDPRVTLSQQVSAQLEQHFGEKVFRAVIPRNVRLAEAPSYGVPGIVFDPQSKGAKAYLEFGAELLVRAGQGAGHRSRQRPAPLHRQVGEADEPPPLIHPAADAAAAAEQPRDPVGRARAGPMPVSSSSGSLAPMPASSTPGVGAADDDMPPIHGSRSTIPEVQE